MTLKVGVPYRFVGARKSDFSTDSLTVVECKDGCALLTRYKWIVFHFALLSDSTTHESCSTLVCNSICFLQDWSRSALASDIQTKLNVTDTTITAPIHNQGRRCTKLSISRQIPFINAQPYFTAYKPASFIVALSTKSIFFVIIINPPTSLCLDIRNTVCASLLIVCHHFWVDSR